MELVMILCNEKDEHTSMTSSSWTSNVPLSILIAGLAFRNGTGVSSAEHDGPLAMSPMSSHAYKGAGFK